MLTGYLRHRWKINSLSLLRVEIFGNFLSMMFDREAKQNDETEYFRNYLSFPPSHLHPSVLNLIISIIHKFIHCLEKRIWTGTSKLCFHLEKKTKHFFLDENEASFTIARLRCKMKNFALLQILNKGCRMYKGDIYLKGHDIKKLALCIYMSRP